MEYRDFKAAIASEPDDNDLRLVFADWLDEHGDTNRAEFIRLQCMLAGTKAPLDDLPALRNREQELLRAHEKEWAAEFFPWADGVEFERGFVSALSTSASHLLENADSLFSSSPIQRLRLHGAHDLMPEIAGRPFLGRIRAIDLSNVSIQDEGLEALLGSPYLLSLESLCLNNTVITNAGLDSLVAWPGFPRLVSLDVSANLIGDRGVVTLAEATSPPTLEEFFCHNNDTGIAAIQAIVGTPIFRALTTLNLSYNGVWDMGCAAISEAPSARSLNVLYLSYAGIQDSGVEALAASPHLGELRELWLDDNDIGDAGLRRLCESTTLTKLERLNVLRCDVGDVGQSTIRPRFRVVL